MRIKHKLHCLTVSLLATLGLIATQAQASPQPLVIAVHIHEDVQIPASEIYRDHLEHWEKSMNEITGRQVNFKYYSPGTGSPINSFDYKGSDIDKTMDEFVSLALRHRHANRSHGNDKLEKTLLITQHTLTPTVGGAAQVRNGSAIASLDSYANAAHELGHLFGATHELSEGGWASLCDTYMSPARNPFKAHCYAFSAANQEQLRDKLSQLP